MKLGPASLRRFILKLLPFATIQKAIKIVDVMDRTSIEVFQAKKAALQQGDEAVLKQVGRGKDIMSILRKDPQVIMDFRPTHNYLNSEIKYDSE